MNGSGEGVNVLIVGAGMYVCGGDMGGFGTVLPTLVQARSQGLVNEIHVAATKVESIRRLKNQLEGLNRQLDTDCIIEGYPTGKDRDSDAYKQAIERLPRPACAIVVVPDHLHASITAEVIRAGIHVMVVKPLAPTMAEGRQLAILAEEFDVFGAVEFHKRYDEANLILRQVILDGKLGDLCYISVEYSQRRSVPEHAFREWAERTNIFQYLGVHYVDLIYFATGARPLRGLATSQNHYLVNRGIDTPDAVQALVEWELPNGRRFVSSFLTHWVDPETTSAMSDQKIAVVGTGGRYESDQKHRGVQVVTDANGIEDINPYFTQIYKGTNGVVEVHGYGPRSILQFLQDVESIHGGRRTVADLSSSRPSFREALVSTAVVEGIAQSLRNGGNWVTITSVN